LVELFRGLLFSLLLSSCCERISGEGCCISADEIDRTVAFGLGMPSPGCGLQHGRGPERGEAGRWETAGTEGVLDWSTVERDREVLVVNEKRDVMFWPEYLLTKGAGGGDGEVCNDRRAGRGGCGGIERGAEIFSFSTTTSSLILTMLGCLLAAE
jgi:hypothetical protein